MKKIDYSEELLKIEDKTKYRNIEIDDTLKTSFMSSFYNIMFPFIYSNVKYVQ